HLLCCLPISKSSGLRAPRRLREFLLHRRPRKARLDSSYRVNVAWAGQAAIGGRCRTARGAALRREHVRRSSTNEGYRRRGGVVTGGRWDYVWWFHFFGLLHETLPPREFWIAGSAAIGRNASTG